MNAFRSKDVGRFNAAVDQFLRYTVKNGHNISRPLLTKNTSVGKIRPIDTRFYAATLVFFSLLVFLRDPTSPIGMAAGAVYLGGILFTLFFVDTFWDSTLELLSRHRFDKAHRFKQGFKDRTPSPWRRRLLTLYAYALSGPSAGARLGAVSILTVWYVTEIVISPILLLSSVLLIPVIGAYKVEIMIRSSPPFAVVLGGSAKHTLMLERQLRLLHYPHRVVSLLRKQNHPSDQHDSRFDTDNFRMAPGKWADVFWLKSVKALCLAANIVFVDVSGDTGSTNDPRWEELIYLEMIGLRYFRFGGQGDITVEDYFGAHRERGFGRYVPNSEFAYPAWEDLDDEFDDGDFARVATPEEIESRMDDRRLFGVLAPSFRILVELSNNTLFSTGWHAAALSELNEKGFVIKGDTTGHDENNDSNAPHYRITDAGILFLSRVERHVGSIAGDDMRKRLTLIQVSHLLEISSGTTFSSGWSSADINELLRQGLVRDSADEPDKDHTEQPSLALTSNGEEYLDSVFLPEDAGGTPSIMPDSGNVHFLTDR